MQMQPCIGAHGLESQSKAGVQASLIVLLPTPGYPCLFHLKDRMLETVHMAFTLEKECLFI